MLAFDPTARTTPLPPPPANPGEDIIDLAAVRAAMRPPAGQAGIPGGSPAISPRGPGGTPSLSSPMGQTSANPPVRTVGTPGGNSPAATNMRAGAQPAAEEAVQTGRYEFEGTAALAKAKPVETLPVRPLPTPGQLNDGPVSTPPNPLALVDRDGNHVSHVSILNSLYEEALKLAVPALSTLAVMMSTEDPSGKQHDSSKVEDPDSDTPDKTTALAIREKRDLVQITGRKIISLAKLGIKNIGNPLMFICEASFYFMLYPAMLLFEPLGATVTQLARVIDQINKRDSLSSLTKLDFLSPTILLEIASFNLGISKKAREMLVRFKMDLWDSDDYDEMLRLLEKYNQRFPYFYQYLDQSIKLVDQFFPKPTEGSWRIKWKLLIEVLRQFEPEMVENVRGVYRPMARNDRLSDYSANILLALLVIYEKVPGVSPANKMTIFFYLLKHKNDFEVFILGDFIKKDFGKVLPVFKDSSGNAEQMGEMLLLILKYRYQDGKDRLKSMMAQIAEWNRARMPLNMQIPAFSQMFGGETRRF